ncbi:MAG: nicotinate (nicotinamide) nucleotide adenylyltransferase [Oscillospiraceae bacterium]|nr:nicotinate (nicotinamide) nucleotide adenylyltransferase [Oscillospiraceae bacterium]
MKIAIYGGSFNPPHLGHVEAARTVAAVLAPDRLLIVPASVPPHKALADGSPTAQQRLELCRLAFADIPGAEISEIELRREGKSYSYDTVRLLREENPDAQLTLVVGTDMLLNFEKWYQFRYLLENCALAVLAREEDDLDELRTAAAYLRESYDADVTVLPHEPIAISSETIRERLGMRGGEDYLSDAVYAEIIRRRYYGAKPSLPWLREKTLEHLDEHRVAHVAGCESEAVRLAMRWGEDPELAAEAGILHDITKSLSFDEQLQLCEKYGIINDNSELEAPKLLHAKTGAALARDLFGVSDTVYAAIRWHTTGKPDMSLFEIILYLADYIEPTRDFEGIDELRELAFTDLDGAMVLGLGMTIDEIRRSGHEPYIDTLDAYAWYKEKEK